MVAIGMGQTMPGRITRTTVFETFRPAIITLNDGKLLKQNEANIFLKNSSLVYKHGRLNMEADMDQVESVNFGDCEYVRVDSVLARVVDTLNNDKLLCVSLIDVDAYRTRHQTSVGKTPHRSLSYLNLSQQPPDTQAFIIMPII